MQKPIEYFHTMAEAFNDWQSIPADEEAYDGYTLYAAWRKPVKKATLTLEAPECGTEFSAVGQNRQNPEVKVNYSGEAVSSSAGGIDNGSDNILTAAMPKTLSFSKPEIFEGKIQCGKKYYIHMQIATREPCGLFNTDSAGLFEYRRMTCELGNITGEVPVTPAITPYTSVTVSVASFTAEHDWDAGKVTKKPTASAAAANKAVTGMKSDKAKGAKYAPLKLRSTMQSKKAVKITWKKVSGAKKYVIYGNACGKKNRMKKLGTVTTTSKTFKKVAGKKVKKATYYKFIVVALDKNYNVISTSKVIHASTKGSRNKANNTSVKVDKKIVKKAQSLKVKKTLSLSAKAAKKKNTKVASHVNVRYESSNKNVLR